MKIKTILTLLFFSTASLFGQAQINESVAVKIEKLKALLKDSDNFSPQMTDSLEINYKVKEQLTEILLAPKTKKYDLAKVFKSTNVEPIYSVDRRLWFFTWFENTGGSFKSNITIIQYRTKANKTGVIIDNEMEEEKSFGFESHGASFNEIIKLPSKSKDLYLCIGQVWGCNSCFANIAIVIELTPNGINLAYPAFNNSEENSSGERSVDGKPDFVIDSRADDIKLFEYDAKKQCINYQYVADDNTPISIDMEQYNPEAKPIVGYLKWNGTRFIETIVGHKPGE